MIALRVIDMQNAYFEDPALAAKKERLVGSCNELLHGGDSAAPEARRVAGSAWLFDAAEAAVVGINGAHDALADFSQLA